MNIGSGLAPFDISGIARAPEGHLRYEERPRSIPHMLEMSLARAGAHAEALVEVGGPRITYGEFWASAGRIAGGLRKRGVEPGDRVSIELSSGVDWCLAFIAAVMAGAIAVPVNTRLTEEERSFIIRDAAVRYRFTSGNTVPRGDFFLFEGTDSTDPAAIFYTSATTGVPKGALLSHENILAATENGRRVRGLVLGEVRDLISVPLFHVTGCISQFLSTLDVAGTCVVLPKFDVASFLSIIGVEGINKVTSVPAIFALALRHSDIASYDLSSVRWLSYGGAPCSPDLVSQIRELFRHAEIGNGYGLTETASTTTFLPPPYSYSRPDSVGFAAPVNELRILNADSRGLGELLVRGQNVVRRYWERPSESASAISDGWLKTGDLASIDDDGFCVIHDRVKDMINRGGEKIFSLEVEQVLEEYPSVDEVAVVGVPDSVMGEKVGAVIVTQEPAKFDVLSLVDFLGAKLADYKVPEFVAFEPDGLPRNAGGKILKRVLRGSINWQRVS